MTDLKLRCNRTGITAYFDSDEYEGQYPSLGLIWGREKQDEESGHYFHIEDLEEGE